MTIEQLFEITDSAFLQIRNPRFWQTERGFQGEFHCVLRSILKERGLLSDGRILEMEYQKGPLHDTNQRPDIIFHVPRRYAKDVRLNNLAVWALKRHGSAKDARDDFRKLNIMFEQLDYPIGIFINIGRENNFSDRYVGNYPERLLTVAVRQDGQVIRRNWGQPQP